MAFIVDSYNKFSGWDRQHAVYVFKINARPYAIKRIEMEWGVPQIGLRVEDNTRPDLYQIYDTLEDAMQFVRQMKAANANV